MNERRDFALGLCLGAMVGAALGILFAPQTGVETRARIRREGEGLSTRAREQAGQVAEQVRQRADEVAGRIRENADELVARARDAAGDAVERGRTVLEEKSERLRRAFQSGRDTVAGRYEDTARGTDEPGL